MHRSGYSALLLLAAIAATPAAAMGAKEPGADGRPVVVVSIEPQAYFVERIGGERVSVSVLVGPGQSPHSYEPTVITSYSIHYTKLYERSASR